MDCLSVKVITLRDQVLGSEECGLVTDDSERGGGDDCHVRVSEARRRGEVTSGQCVDIELELSPSGQLPGDRETRDHSESRCDASGAKHTL